MSDPGDALPTLDEVAAYLKAGKRTVYRLAQKVRFRRSSSNARGAFAAPNRIAGLPKASTRRSRRRSERGPSKQPTRTHLNREGEAAQAGAAHSARRPREVVSHQAAGDGKRQLRQSADLRRQPVGTEGVGAEVLGETEMRVHRPAVQYGQSVQNVANLPMAEPEPMEWASTIPRLKNKDAAPVNTTQGALFEEEDE